MGSGSTNADSSKIKSSEMESCSNIKQIHEEGVEAVKRARTADGSGLARFLREIYTSQET